MSSSSELDATRYLEALKELLKDRGFTYADLAKALGCSLPTVKRALNKPSLPLSRLLEFCEVTQIAFEDLHRRAERHRPQHYVFTDEQDHLFAERDELLDYLLELVTEGTTPTDIAERHGLDQRSTALYLEHLSSVGLVELQDRNRVKLRVEPPLGFGPRSRVLRKQQKKFMKAIAANVLDADPAKTGCVAVFKPLDLTEEDYGQMVGELEGVVNRFAAIAEREIGRGSTSHWQVALAAGPGSKVKPRQLPRITH